VLFHKNDVIFGRGGSYELLFAVLRDRCSRLVKSDASSKPKADRTNNDDGNKTYLVLINTAQSRCLGASKQQKHEIAIEIVQTIRGQTPAGQFLRLDDKSGLWNDVGNQKA
jgi:hypothetical protein